ncbi:MAG: SH3 domain-containing protein [Alphaproteobacteria bacterium]|nr:SH3 domain-containing protein [Alphaproteobacteria bacterium]
MSAEKPVGIPLKIAPELPKNHNFERFSLKVEGMMSGARLSRGQTTGDTAWSLSLDDLGDLLYLPPSADFAPHSVQVRLIGYEDDFASTVSLTDYEIKPTDSVPIPASEPAASAAPAGVSTSTVTDQLDKAIREAREKAGAGTAGAASGDIAAARAEWEKKASEREAALKVALEAEKQSLVSAAQASAESSTAAQQAAFEQQLMAMKEQAAGAEARVSAAEAAAEEIKRALAETLLRAERAEEAAEQAQAQAESKYQVEIRTLRDELAAAEAIAQSQESTPGKIQQQLEELQKLHAAELVQKQEEMTVIHAAEMAARAEEVESRLKIEFEIKVAEARAEVERESAVRLAGLEAQTKKTIAAAREAAIAEARVQWVGENDQANAAVGAATEGEMAERIATARLQWQSELQAALTDRDLHWEGELNRRLAESSGQGSGAAAPDLSAARSEWEAEHQKLMAARDEQWQEQLNRQLADARSAWEYEEDRRMAAQNKEQPPAQNSTSPKDLANAPTAAATVDVAPTAVEAPSEDGRMEPTLNLTDVAIEEDSEAPEKEKSSVQNVVAAAGAFSLNLAKKMKNSAGPVTAIDHVHQEAKRRSGPRRSHKTIGGRIGAMFGGIGRLFALRRLFILGVVGGALYGAFLYLPAVKPFAVEFWKSFSGDVAAKVERKGRKTKSVKPVAKALSTRGVPTKRVAKKRAPKKPSPKKPVPKAPIEVKTPVPVKKPVEAKLPVAPKNPVVANVPTKKKPAPRSAYIKPAAAKLRRAPALDAEVIAVARRADKVLRLAVKGSWVKIRTPGTGENEGWVPSDMLSDSAPK